MRKIPDRQTMANQIRELRRHAKRDLYPKMAESAMFLSLYPSDGTPDAKFCLELGMAIMLDKPIIAVTKRGVPVAKHMLRVADKVVELDWDDPDATAEALRKAMMELQEELGL